MTFPNLILFFRDRVSSPMVMSLKINTSPSTIFIFYSPFYVPYNIPNAPRDAHQWGRTNLILQLADPFLPHEILNILLD